MGNVEVKKLEIVVGKCGGVGTLHVRCARLSEEEEVDVGKHQPHGDLVKKAKQEHRSAMVERRPLKNTPPIGNSLKTFEHLGLYGQTQGENTLSIVRARAQNFRTQNRPFSIWIQISNTSTGLYIEGGPLHWGWGEYWSSAELSCSPHQITKRRNGDAVSFSPLYSHK